jgi:hypothetical protein
MGSMIKETGVLAGGGPNNSRFQAQGVDLQKPATVEQANKTYEEAQAALGQQAALATALQAQGNQGMGSQSALTQALQQQMNGGGPNPAQAQLAQNTAANTANQAALMAGQRGAAGNAGLMARQAAGVGAQNQQAAAGQAATLQAQQQLAAQQQLQALANAQIGQQSGAVNAYNQAAQGEQGNILNSINAQNAASVAMQSNINNANAGMAQTNANNSAKFTGGVLNAVGGAIGGPMGSMFAHGGMVGENPKLAQVAPSNRLPDHLEHVASIYHSNYALGGPVTNLQVPTETGSPQAIANTSQLGGDKKGAGASPAGTSPMDMSANPVTGGGAMAGGPADAVGAVEADPAMLAMVANKGAMVPGKARVSGDSEKNDTVPALLSPGEVVIPRHVLNSDDPVGNSAKFVKALLEKHQSEHGGKDEHDDFKSALKQAIASRKKK